MALLSGFPGVYTEAIIKKCPSRNINVQNLWLYIFGMLFNIIAIFIQDFDAVVNNFFHGYTFIIVCMILNHALSGIAVSLVMKYDDNIVKVYATSVAILLTGIISVFIFGFNLSLAFFLGATVVSVSVDLRYIGSLAKLQAMFTQIRTELLINIKWFILTFVFAILRLMRNFNNIKNTGSLASESYESWSLLDNWLLQQRKHK